MSKRRDLIMQLLVNCMPLVGFWYFNWNMFAIIYIYWAEGFIVAFYTCAKIAIANGPDNHPAERFYIRLISAFKHLLFRFGVLFFYWIFIYAFVAHPNGNLALAIPIQNKNILLFKDHVFNNLWLVYLLSQLILFFSSFIATDDYKNKPSSEYKVLFDIRTIVLHFVIVLGTFGYQVFENFESYNNKLPALAYILVLVVIKSIADIVQYKHFGTRI